MIEYPPEVPPLPDDYTEEQLRAHREALRVRGWEIQRRECEARGDLKSAAVCEWFRDGMPMDKIHPIIIDGVPAVVRRPRGRKKSG